MLHFANVVFSLGQIVDNNQVVILLLVMAIQTGRTKKIFKSMLDALIAPITKLGIITKP